ncbi:MAG: hypothetical protein H6737_05695 [Alphaproteobacteria bacterium]|nr:hypothetical protein [Alphaproteobacteria bacterium]
MPVDVAPYLDFLPEPLLARLDAEAEPVPGVPGLRVAPGLQAAFPAIETADALRFVCDVYRDVRSALDAVLTRRKADRAVLDEATAAYATANAGLDYRDPAYRTVIGLRDADGRLLVGPHPERPAPPRVEVPDFLAGEQITLFGPPDTAKMSINAMNALHRVSPDEPAILTRLVEESGQVPRWGADDEDSKTPLMRDFLAACANIIGCFDRTLVFDDPANGKHYALAKDRLSRPIKRVPGLALPDGSHLLDGSPLPLHLYDFCLHAFHNRERPEALVYYVPKLENEEEAAYVRMLVERTEAGLAALDPGYRKGTIRLMIVFENPRAIFRIREIAHALGPHFLGGSLGWHDFLGSTARLFRNDPCYRIPVKADPDIVIDHIRESHRILAGSLKGTGALRLGGMYGVLPEAGDPASWAVSVVGFVRDVVTQLRRDLDGFWVAHPDFVRIGIALVEAWRRWDADRDDPALVALLEAIVPDPSEREPLLAFVYGEDARGLEADDPLYLRAVLAADVNVSKVIANDHPDEIRYNVFQAVQYLADWLCGNGCVALPAKLKTAGGDSVFVRIMDDLATTERSRWELWAEVHHKRVSVETFDRILAEEMGFIREGRATATKRVAVPHDARTARWYPIAERLVRQLVVTEAPPEFVTELLLPFTFAPVRDADDPWAAAQALCPGRYH